MFKRAALLTGAVLVLTGALMVQRFVSITPQDKTQYQQIQQMSNPGEQRLSSSEYSGNHTRKGVIKDLWYSRGETRLHFRIISESSELRINHIKEKKGTEMIEDMTDVTCYLQERLYYQLPSGEEATLTKEGLLKVSGKKDTSSSTILFETANATPMQEVRMLTTDTASYDYDEGIFSAELVNIYQFVLPDHELPDTLEDFQPLMAGRAASVTFQLMNENPQIEAEHFQAILYNWKGELPWKKNVGS